jgi:hypothetical protein
MAQTKQLRLGTPAGVRRYIARVLYELRCGQTSLQSADVQLEAARELLKSFAESKDLQMDLTK